MNVIKKSTDLEKIDNDFVLATSDLDRHFEVVDIEGMNIDHFKRNPIMLYNHNPEDVIGKWENIRKENGKLIAKPVFYINDDKAKKVKELVQAGIIKGASVSFTPNEIDEIEPPKEVGNILNYFGYLKIRKYSKSILNEVSIVSIPANPYALAKSLMNKEIDLENYSELFEMENFSKAGAVLNKNNLQKLQEAKSLIEEVIKSAKIDDGNDEKNLIYGLSELYEIMRNY